MTRSIFVFVDIGKPPTFILLMPLGRSNSEYESEALAETEVLEGSYLIISTGQDQESFILSHWHGGPCQKY